MDRADSHRQNKLCNLPMIPLSALHSFQPAAMSSAISFSSVSVLRELLVMS